MQKNTISFKGQKIFIGIDVHKKNWDVAVAPEVGVLARTLKAGLLKGVYVRERDNLDDRSVIRIRKTIQKDLSSYRVRIKHLLHNNGVSIPERFEKSGSYWSRAFMRWLKEDVNLLSSSKNSLNLLISQVEAIRSTLLESTLLMRELSQTERYKKNVDLLTTIPGIGVTIAMCILTG
ncbi:MAG: hypothetical protein IKX55_07305 [Bacteroidaceae bacterium]|nr:hypothetical protein [Bacteroidaceae bacterium]